jgi:hypothetical protein
LTFQARVIVGELDSRSKTYERKKASFYQLNLLKAITDSSKEAKSVTIFTENRDDEYKDQAISFIKKDVAIQKDIKLIDSNISNLYQLGNLLTGCIFSEEHGIENKTKLRILNHLKNKLAVKKISELYDTNENSKFSLRKADIK